MELVTGQRWFVTQQGKASQYCLIDIQNYQKSKFYLILEFRRRVEIKVGNISLLSTQYNRGMKIECTNSIA